MVCRETFGFLREDRTLLLYGRRKVDGNWSCKETKVTRLVDGYP